MVAALVACCLVVDMELGVLRPALLRSAVLHNRTTPRSMALFIKEQGCSLREIGVKLAESGFHPPRGGRWHAQTVILLLTVSEHPDAFSVRKAS